MRYFINTGDGIDFADTPEEAARIAQHAIDGWRDCCDPEWPEEVESVCWGPIHGQSTQVEIDDTHADYKLSDPPIGPDEKQRMLDFFFSQMRSHDATVNGIPHWRFQSTGWPMTHCKGPTAIDAVRAAMAEVEKAKQEASDGRVQ